MVITDILNKILVINASKLLRNLPWQRINHSFISRIVLKSFLCWAFWFLVYLWLGLMEIDCFPLTRELSPVAWASHSVNRFLDYGMHNWCHDNESWSFLCSVSLFLLQLLQSLWRHPAGQKKKWKLLRKVNLVKPLTSFWILAFTKFQGFTESLSIFAVTFANTMLIWKLLLVFFV